MSWHLSSQSKCQCTVSQCWCVPTWAHTNYSTIKLVFSLYDACCCLNKQNVKWTNTVWWPRVYTGLEGLDRLIPNGVVNYDLVSQVMLQANMIPQQLSTSYLHWFACRFENWTQFCYVLFVLLFMQNVIIIFVSTPYATPELWRWHVAWLWLRE